MVVDCLHHTYLAPTRAVDTLKMIHSFQDNGYGLILLLTLYVMCNFMQPFPRSSVDACFCCDIYILFPPEIL